MSFAQKITASASENIYLVLGGKDHSGQDAWYFLRVDKPKQNAFLRAIKSGAAQLESYGEMIESGYGQEPPASIVSQMRANWGYSG